MSPKTVIKVLVGNKTDLSEKYKKLIIKATNNI